MRVLLVATLLAGLASLPAVATAQTPPPLDPARYAAIEHTLKVQLPLDKSLARSHRRAYAASCQTLSLTDPLLSRYRKFCTTGARVYDAYALPCKTRRECLRQFARLPSALDSFISVYSSLNRRVDAEVSDPECRRALRSPKGALASYRRLASALRRLRKALLSGSQRSVRAAQAHLDHVNATSTTRTNKRQLRDFQQGCGA